MRALLTALAMLAALISLWSTPQARADEQSPSSRLRAQKVDREQLRQLYAGAIGDYSQGRLDAAAAGFERIRALDADPAVRFYLADIYLLQGRRSDAQALLSEFLRTLGESGNPQDYAVEVKRSAELVEQLSVGWQPVGPEAESDAWVEPTLRGVMINSVVIGAASMLAGVLIHPGSMSKEQAAEVSNYHLRLGAADALFGSAFASAAISVGAGITLMVRGKGRAQLTPAVGPAGGGLRFEGVF